MTHEALIEQNKIFAVATCAVTGRQGLGGDGRDGCEDALVELDEKCPDARHICPTWATWRPETADEGHG